LGTSRIALFAVALVLTAGCAGAKPARPSPQPAPAGSDCALTHTSRDVLSLKKLPASIRAALIKTAGGMADRGAFFNATDVVVKPAPFSRFIRAGHTQGTWYVWYEHGGFAYWRQVVLFMIDPAGHVHTKANQTAHGQDLCAMTDALLDGKTH